MKMTIEDVNFNGFVREHKKLLLVETHLLDPEVRLLRLYRLLANYFSKSRHYRTFNLSYREIKSILLPNWSIGKLSGYTKSLIKKGYIKRISRTILYVYDETYLVQTYENTDHSTEEHVQLAEQFAQGAEQNESIEERRNKRIKELKEKSRELALKKSLS